MLLQPPSPAPAPHAPLSSHSEAEAAAPSLLSLPSHSVRVQTGDAWFVLGLQPDCCYIGLGLGLQLCSSRPSLLPVLCTFHMPYPGACFELQGNLWISGAYSLAARTGLDPRVSCMLFGRRNGVTYHPKAQYISQRRLDGPTT